MKAGWEVRPLGEIATLRPNKKEAKKSLHDNDAVSFVPMDCLQVGEKSLAEHKFRPLGEVYGGYTYFRDGDVLLAKITPCFENGKLGIARELSNGVGFGSSEFFVIRPLGEVLAEYLYHFLDRDEFRIFAKGRMTGAVGHKRVPKELLEALLIPLPPLEEQGRIVAVLDEAFASLSRARAHTEANLQNARELFDRTASEAFDEIIQKYSDKLHTVEDVALNRKGSIRTGPFGSQLKHSEFVDSGIAVLGIDNAVNNEFRWGKSRFITEAKYAELKRYTVQPGDVIITIMGTCGRCAVIPDDIPVAVNTKHLCCITLDQSRCLPEYLHRYFLHSETAIDYLGSQASGSVMDGLNMGIIKALPVVLPNLSVQEKLVRKLESVDVVCRELVSFYTNKLRDLDDLRQSLLQKAFAGELT